MKAQKLKYTTIAAGLVWLGGCAELSNNRASDQAEEVELQALLAQAKSEKDYRFLVFASRRLVIPGFEEQKAEQLKAQCGVRYWRSEGDVLYPSQARSSRVAKYQFASDYNQVIYTLCRQVN
ncbi:hypothetical protein N474_15820 [Pseudoalteromonas luteoviolacea CPMOR-2]|uniref:Lipoprotein n=1 Tax=Pseudoalteromonas luteoviolacea DSM 6061 TaxID=1365250 RepID=A0A166XRG6_9GAMM|nr:hypothetical protein [Pseudoalteromonas luteoviolacea]KZN40714.1 hypothetical protein N475_11340 [Pseudoalteromonas luteoviolacea DSM 6061]KZN55171.1 hypothetical protein N474_15820 [Pseudoalteromonas luteoviolacea CPMOR-2]MBE0387774.1 hypothetical protein [Pseudoalteromonas luteoviolacea DSM 6061]